MLFSLYLLFMAFLTTSLVLAARSSGDPSQYESPLDWFRLFCEIVTLVWILLDLVLEFYELGRVMLVVIPSLYSISMVENTYYIIISMQAQMY